MMNISASVANVGMGYQNIYMGPRYPNRTIEPVSALKANDYSIRRSVETDVTALSLKNISPSKLHMPVNKSVILNDGSMFVGTIVDLIA
jgi:hypothetical protein